MHKQFLENVKTHLSLYNLEQVLLEYGNNARRRGFYRRNEFMRICLWKSSRQKIKYKSNSKAKVEAVTREAFLLIDERKRIDALRELKGVGIPVASALLTFHSINKYAIIDIRCVEELRRQKLIRWKHITGNSWVNYLDLLQKLSKKVHLTPRQFEKGLFAYHRENQVKRSYSNVYKKNSK